MILFFSVAVINGFISLTSHSDVSRLMFKNARGFLCYFKRDLNASLEINLVSHLSWKKSEMFGLYVSTLAGYKISVGAVCLLSFKN